MIDLSRTVRFCVELAAAEQAPSFAQKGPHPAIDHPRHNTFAGWPSMSGIGVYYELDVTCRGKIDPLTGYMLNISAIDKAVREHAVPIVQNVVRSRPQISPGAVVAEILPVLQSALAQTVAGVRWRLSPYYSVAMNPAVPDRVSLSQQFEFAAAHRLHVPSLSEDANRETFGKCNNPNGHGHNYRIEVTITAPIDTFTVVHLERIVDETIIQRFDHKHLNLDTAEFAKTNPSVENISKVCHDLLVGPLMQAGAPLERVTVWETEKTRCSYPAGGSGAFGGSG